MRATTAIAAIAALVYALLWVGWTQHWGWLASIDDAALRPLHDFGVKHPAWVRFWDTLCTVFSPESFRVLGLAVIVIAIVRRNWRVVVFTVATIGISGFVNQIFKNLADRPRPSGALVSAASTSFPSGHAMGVMVAVLALLAITWPVVGRRARIVSLVVGAALVATIGTARVVLNVHNPSDVLAGWSLGYLWFLGCWLVIRPRPLNGEVADGTPEAPGTDH